MIVGRVTLCALALMLGTTQLRAEETQPTSKPNAVEKKTNEKTAATKQDAAAAKSKAAKKPKEEDEKVVDGVKLQTIEANIVSYTNQERVQHGLEPLVVDEELMKTARDHAAWMTESQNLVHTSMPVAENIAMGQPHSSDAVNAWMNSPGHRANILNSGHRRIGVAAFRAASGVIFWCQQFLQ